ncbi:Fe2+-dependent dioxygenase [Oceaniserpentilla sp. 4NH20-0058]|uniref:Fe2+-dependent dioxygenase n=1 Tax=Oceaniserpentilla sp. 4NH20-0058 TaxID=3127660 RepID=UPI003107CA14
MLLPIEQIISRDDALRLRQAMEQAQWHDGKRTAGGLSANVKSNLQLDEQSELALQLGRVITQALQQHPLFISATLPHTVFPPRFNCYQGGGHYGLHIDGAIMHLPDGNIMRSDVSATLFLSDADEYEGGELSIETQFGAQEVKLNAGDIILYPSSSLHEVKPVTKGQRIASFFWIQSMVPDASRREQLFELDQSIQILTADRGAADHEVRRLSGLYHNLLRDWSVM